MLRIVNCTCDCGKSMCAICKGSQPEAVTSVPEAVTGKTTTYQGPIKSITYPANLRMRNVANHVYLIPPHTDGEQSDGRGAPIIADVSGKGMSMTGSGRVRFIDIGTPEGAAEFTRSHALSVRGTEATPVPAAGAMDALTTALDAWKDEMDALPLGHADVQKGSSTFNWMRSAYDFFKSYQSNAATQASQQQVAIEELCGALEWYGEQARLCRLIHREGDIGRNNLDADGGKKAKAAVARAQSLINKKEGV